MAYIEVNESNAGDAGASRKLVNNVISIKDDLTTAESDIADITPIEIVTSFPETPVSGTVYIQTVGV